MTEGHPSYYALDRARLGLSLSPAEQEHLAECPACADHVRGGQEPVPPWLGSVIVQPVPRRRRAFLFPALTAVAIVALVAVGIFRQEPGIREKGIPAVTVFVKRGEKVFTWDGQPLRPDDRLRLRVAAAGYPHVSVASLSDANEATVLYEGAMESGPLLLPLSFRVDDEGRREQLSIIFARSPVPATLHQAAPGAPDIWRRLVTFEKEPPP